MAHARRVVTKPRLLTKARKLCLGLPQATEKEAWGGPTFRVRNKMFAMYMDNHHGSGRVAFWLKAPDGAQETLVESDPERFFVPPYVGPNGWVGVYLDKKADWGEVTDLVEEAYRLVAGKRLCAELDAG